MQKILLVEDDRELALVVGEWLISENYAVDTVHEGKSGYAYLSEGHYDLAILDWSLPGLTGVEILQKYRANHGGTPVLMLTGKNEIAEKEQALDAGADDYLTKPFAMRELSARLRALSRRSLKMAEESLKVGKIEIDPRKHKVKKDGKEVHLLPKDFALLEFLMRHPDEVFSSESLLQRVWNFDHEVTTDALRTSIKRLRKMFDDSENEDDSFIESVRRVGYRLRVTE